VWLAALAAPVSSAEIRHTKPEEIVTLGVGGANLIFEGKIEAGDYDKLLSVIDRDCANDNCLPGILLASPGGDLSEAMKIGRLVRKLRLETHAPAEVPSPYRQKAEAVLKDAKANYMCASSCFFLFVAGINRQVDVGRPILGIHRPYFSEVELTRLTGNQVTASAEQIRKAVEDYLKEMGVPTRYTDLMFSIPKDQIRSISEADFKSDFEGYIPELRDWIEATCNNLTDVEKIVSKGIFAKNQRREKLPEDEERTFRLLVEKYGKQGQCELQALLKMRANAWKQFHGQ